MCNGNGNGGNPVAALFSDELIEKKFLGYGDSEQEALKNATTKFAEWKEEMGLSCDDIDKKPSTCQKVTSGGQIGRYAYTIHIAYRNGR